MARQDPGEPYARIDSDEASAMVQEDPNGTVVIDVRRDDEWVTGDVSGAIHIAVDDLIEHMDQVPQDKKLLFICLLYTSPRPRDGLLSRMPSSA